MYELFLYTLGLTLLSLTTLILQAGLSPRAHATTDATTAWATTTPITPSSITITTVPASSIAKPIETVSFTAPEPELPAECNLAVIRESSTLLSYPLDVSNGIDTSGWRDLAVRILRIDHDLYRAGAENPAEADEANSLRDSLDHIVDKPLWATCEVVREMQSKFVPYVAAGYGGNPTSQELERAIGNALTRLSRRGLPRDGLPPRAQQMVIFFRGIRGGRPREIFQEGGEGTWTPRIFDVWRAMDAMQESLVKNLITAEVPARGQVPRRL